MSSSSLKATPSYRVALAISLRLLPPLSFHKSLYFLRFFLPAKKKLKKGILTSISIGMWYKYMLSKY